MDITNFPGHQYCCHNFFHLVLWLPAVLNGIVVLILLLLLCPPYQRYQNSVQGEPAHVCLLRFDT